ncbi:hypothetical protein [Pectobacterium versatile]|uniref:hypothetical protein n=1 Tax=Pectobacterium versatile TaxID=2488639 RepID=UPI001CF1E1DF|nr:hypothetical protein [Pectobacterium versatile]MCA6927919.1 hypothetical protein [Pectobacterium versatile]MCH5084663.1 hypothetical protein [Pectobacterium versatile]
MMIRIAKSLILLLAALSFSVNAESAGADGICTYKNAKWERNVSYDKSLDAVNTTGNGGVKIYIGGVTEMQVIHIKGVSTNLIYKNNGLMVSIDSDYFGHIDSGSAYAGDSIMIPMPNEKLRDAIKKTKKIKITVDDFKKGKIYYEFDISGNPLDTPYSCTK